MTLRCKRLDGATAEILDFIDDDARYAIFVTARLRVTGPIVVASFRKACETHGIPSSTLTDNGMVFTTRVAEHISGYFLVEENENVDRIYAYTPDGKQNVYLPVHFASRVQSYGNELPAAVGWYSSDPGLRSPIAAHIIAEKYCARP